MSNTAVIWGCGGQDGSYLAPLLLEKNQKVVGVVRRSSLTNTSRLSPLLANPSFTLVEGDVSDPHSVNSILDGFQPDFVYNLAAMSHVATSFQQPHFTTLVDYLGPLNILEWMRARGKKTRFYQAGSSEEFGGAWSIGMGEYRRNFFGPPPDAHLSRAPYQDEDTPFSPNSPYAIAKLAAHHLVRIYREAYGLHASVGILMNHESPRRGEQFVTRKITRHIGRLKRAMDAGRAPPPKLRLGNLDAYRDWGFSEDYCRAMILMMEQPNPDDYVIATGSAHSVRDFLKRAFLRIGVGVDDMPNYYEIDPAFFRPCEVPYLRGNPSKAERVLGWKPHVSFDQLVDMMVDYDLESFDD
jgi:GDPmannose 4,6-dehydratase